MAHVIAPQYGIGTAASPESETREQFTHRQPFDDRVRNKETARRVDHQGRAHGYVCPYCTERFSGHVIETHTLLAHGKSFFVEAINESKA